MEYTVIYEASLQKLITKVNVYIEEGWQPQGGVSVAIAQGKILNHETGDATIFNCYQAMIKNG